MRRKLLLGAAVLGAVVGVPAIALAAGSSGSTPVNCVLTHWSGTSATTSSSSFQAIPGLAAGTASVFPMTITVSAVVRGQPVAIEVQDTWVGGTFVSPPGPALFVPPGGAASSFSFTWTDPGSAAALRGHQLAVLWRRTSAAGSSTLLGGDIAVGYHGDTCPGSN
jgi:hypothetical protein